MYILLLLSTPSTDYLLILSDFCCEKKKKMIPLTKTLKILVLLEQRVVVQQAMVDQAEARETTVVANLVNLAIINVRQE